MQNTTVKIRRSTRLALNEFKGEKESYDDAINKLISKIKKKNLREDLIEGYKKMGPYDLELISEWEIASKEV